jgi:uncharacterized membrane protein
MKKFAEINFFSLNLFFLHHVFSFFFSSKFIYLLKRLTGAAGVNVGTIFNLKHFKTTDTRIFFLKEEKKNGTRKKKKRHGKSGRSHAIGGRNQELSIET